MGIQIVSILLVILTAVYVMLVLYMRKGWSRLPIFHKATDTHPQTAVSILVAARNEASNIGTLLDSLLAQEYPRELFEIIVIDDHSTDETSSLVASYAPRGVRLITLNEAEPLNSYKKKAISEGIQIATGELIVTTDADCRMGQQWLSTVVAYYEKHKLYMVSSPVVYSNEQNLFEEVQTLEFLYLIGLGAAGIGNQHPATCNGANLAYRRDVFHEMGGFTGIDDLASGDDELLLHKIAEKYPTRIGFCKSIDATVHTDAKPTLSAFISQRRRWASKSTKYRDKAIVALGVSIWLFNACLLAMGIIAIIQPGYIGLFLGAMAVKFLVEIFFLSPVTTFAGRRSLLKYLPILTFIHVLYMVYIGIAGNAGKYDWKGRRVK